MIQNVLRCLVALGSASLASAQYDIDVRVADVDGSPFTGRATVNIWQAHPFQTNEWSAGLLQFDSNGIAQYSFNDLNGIDDTLTAWVVVQVEDTTVPQAHSGRFFTSKGAASRGTSRIRIPATPPSGPVSLSAKVEIVGAPLYARVQVPEASASAQFNLFMTDAARASDASFDRITVVNGNKFVDIYSWSTRAKVGCVLQDSDDNVAYRGVINRGSEKVIDTAPVGFVSVDVGARTLFEVSGVFMVPASEHVVPTAAETSSRLRAHVRLQGTLRPYQCYRIDGTSKYETDGLLPGAYVVEFWESSTLDGVGPFVPSFTVTVNIVAGAKQVVTVP